ncbi:hypothetical protein [Mycolicibacterium sp.]|uniref:hypothetical protein n=1 Tax=Mycolicibacterium sp. TaxID=2320850 RepID=UPI003560D806
MTRTAVVPGRSVLSDQEWARTVEQRLRALANPQTQRVGEFVLSSRGGQLVATRPGQAPLEVGGVAEPEVIPLGPDRGGYAMDLESLAEAVGYPEDAPRPESENDIRQWLLSNLFGPISASRVPRLPWSHLFDGVAELLADPSFDNASTFFGAVGISHDAAFGRLKPGSGRVTADGTTHTFVSNAIEVDQGELLPVGVWTFYESVVAAANSDAIRVSVRAYSVNPETSVRTHVGTELIDAVASPAGESADHPDAEDDWVHLEGAYAVPLGVNEVVVEVTVTPDATAGDVWVDDASAKKTRDGMPQAWIKNLIPDLSSLWNGLTGMVDQLLTHLGLPLVGDFWDRLFDLSDEIAWIQDRAESAREDLTTLLSDLLTNPASVLGSIPQTLVTGLSNVVSQFNQVRDILAGLVVTPVNDAIQDIKDAWSGVHTGISNVVDDVRDTWRGFWNGIFRTPGDTTQRSAAEVQEAAETLSMEVDSTQNSTVYLQTLLTLLTLPRYTPRWLSSGPQDDAAFPLSLINGTTMPALGQLVLIPVTAEATRTYESIKFGMSSFTMTSLHLGVYEYNDGDLVRIVNLGDVKSEMLATSLQAVNLDTPISVNRGQTLYIGILQVGGTPAAMRCWNGFSGGIIEPAQEIPNWVGSKYGSGLSSLPTSFSAGVITEQVPPIWGAMGAETGVPTINPPVHYTDNFNRATLGALWIPESGAPAIRSSSQYGTRAEPYDTPHMASYALPYSTLDQEVYGYGDISDSARYNQTQYAAVCLRFKDKNNFVYLREHEIGNAFSSTFVYRIATCINGVHATRSEWNGGSGGATLTFRAIGNAYYHSDFHSWVDSGNVFEYTNANNKAAVITTSYSAGGTQLDNFYMKDI